MYALLYQKSNFQIMWMGLCQDIKYCFQFSSFRLLQF